MMHYDGLANMMQTNFIMMKEHNFSRTRKHDSVGKANLHRIVG